MSYVSRNTQTISKTYLQKSQRERELRADETLGHTLLGRSLAVDVHNAAPSTHAAGERLTSRLNIDNDERLFHDLEAERFSGEHDVKALYYKNEEIIDDWCIMKHNYVNTWCLSHGCIWAVTQHPDVHNFLPQGSSLNDPLCCSFAEF